MAKFKKRGNRGGGGGNERGGFHGNNPRDGFGNNPRGGKNKFRGGGDGGGGRWGHKPEFMQNAKLCKNGCGWNNTHATHECTKPKQYDASGPQNKNNRIDKHHGNNGPNNGLKTMCTRCGYTNHKTAACTTSPVGTDAICACGSEYHTSNKCPWDQDPAVREAFQDQAEGKLCQWCKGDGDGLHTYNSCGEAVKFRTVLKANIQKMYDELLWCWHCQSEEHKTRACDKPDAALGKGKWETRIAEIMQEWIEQDMTHIGASYGTDGGGDTYMPAPSRNLKAPVAIDYPWCIFCQEFGHWASAYACPDMTEFNNRCPKRFQGRDGLVKSYVSSGSSSKGAASLSDTIRGGNGWQEHLADHGGDVIIAKCMSCRERLVFRAMPGKLGDAVMCSKCKTWNPHPASALRKDSKVELFQEIRKLMEATTSALSGSTKKKVEKDLYKYRPSVNLPAELALDRWPEQQPRYTDLGARKESTGSPIFSQHMDVYNMVGNAQSYFPPILIRLSGQDQREAANDELPINRAGRLGLHLECKGCGTPGVVRDDEGDLVMMATDAANTLGCGWGYAEWSGTHYKLKCKCNTIVGKASNPVWLYS
jgi:hypothetical protein